MTREEKASRTEVVRTHSGKSEAVRRQLPSRKKAVAGFMVFLLVAALVTAIVLFGEFVLQSILPLSEFVNIKGKLGVFMANDDIGTELVALLNAKTAEVKHIELLGRYTVSAIDEERSEQIKPLKATLDSAYANYDFTFTGNQTSVKFSKGVPSAIQDESRTAIINCPTSFNQVPQDVITELEKQKLRWPSDSKTIVSGFGGRELKQGQCNCHGGIDIAGDNFNVYASVPGIVKRVYRSCKESGQGKEECNGGYGNIVVVEHFSGKFYTIYAHLSSIDESIYEGRELLPNDIISKPIAKSGNTGRTEGPHLHFELSTSERGGDRNSIPPCGFLNQAGVTGKPCDHEKVAACSYVTGMIAGKGVRSYETDIPLPGPFPGAKPENLTGVVTFKQWD